MIARPEEAYVPVVDLPISGQVRKEHALSERSKFYRRPPPWESGQLPGN